MRVDFPTSLIQTPFIQKEQTWSSMREARSCNPTSFLMFLSEAIVLGNVRNMRFQG